MESNTVETASQSLLRAVNSPEGTMDHVTEILASHAHSLILVGRSAQRWMGSAGCANNALESITSDLVETGQWVLHNPGPHLVETIFPSVECDADVVLRRTEVRNECEYEYLCLWLETTYRLSVDTCPVVEVPDVYSWHHVLMEETWHPAIGREDGWWVGPRLHPDTKVPNLPERAIQPSLFHEGWPRGISSTKHFPVHIPSLPAYLDALIYHVTRYKISKPGLASIASWQIRNLTRYLYLELPRQQLPLLMELEEDQFMEEYLRNYKRKPFFVYRAVGGNELEATRVKEWDPASYPEWCDTMKHSSEKVQRGAEAYRSRKV
jgi:hypothetical protein